MNANANTQNELVPVPIGAIELSKDFDVSLQIGGKEDLFVFACRIHMPHTLGSGARVFRGEHLLKPLTEDQLRIVI